MHVSFYLMPYFLTWNHLLKFSLPWITVHSYSCKSLLLLCDYFYVPSLLFLLFLHGFPQLKTITSRITDSSGDVSDLDTQLELIKVSNICVLFAA